MTLSGGPVLSSLLLRSILFVVLSTWLVSVFGLALGRFVCTINADLTRCWAIVVVILLSLCLWLSTVMYLVFSFIIFVFRVDTFMLVTFW
jgi:hypothetical protein